MKRTKWSFFCLVLLGVCSFTHKGLAQEAKTAAESAQLAVNKWSKDVNLTESQIRAITELATVFAIQRDSINALDSIPFEDCQTLKKEAHATYLSSVESLLSDSQKKQVEKKRAERKAAVEKKKNSSKK
jgi:hypothetical protein